MKLFIKILILIFISLVFINNIKAQGCKARLTIKPGNNEAVVYLQNKRVGTGDTDIEVSKGNYILTIIKDSSEWNAEKIIDTILIKECKEYNFTYSFEKEIFLKTLPADASVFNGDSLLGCTPIRLFETNSIITLKKNGYASKNIFPDKLVKNNIIKLDFTGIPNGTKFIDGSLFRILLGGITVLGGIAAYYKLKADDNFEQYQFTGKNKLLNLTRKYDLISGISFGLLQVNFGILIYYFLID